MCMYVHIHVCIDISYLSFCWLWAWLAPCSGVSVVNFGQVNAGWVLVILMIRFLLTNNIFD